MNGRSAEGTSIRGSLKPEARKVSSSFAVSGTGSNFPQTANWTVAVLNVLRRDSLTKPESGHELADHSDQFVEPRPHHSHIGYRLEISVAAFFDKQAV